MNIIFTNKELDKREIYKHTRMEAYYNDIAAKLLHIDGHTLEVPPNICLETGEYTWGLPMEYKRYFI